MERTELVEQMYDAFGRGDLDAIRPHVHNDLEIVERLEVPGARVFHGIEGWLRGYEEDSEAIDDFRVGLKGTEELGGRCVADIVIGLRGRESGAEVEERIAHLIEFREDRVARVRAFSSLDEARAVARVECIGELYGMWAQGELEAAIGRVHPEIEWVEPEETIGAQRRIGRDAALEGIEQWAQSFDSYDGALTGISAEGDSVVAEFVQRVRAGGSSVELETQIFHVWAFSDGVPAKMAMYFDADQAAQAAKS